MPSERPFFKPVAFEAGITLNETVASELWVKGDGGQLRRLVMILLDNGVKYAGDRGGYGLGLSIAKSIADAHGAKLTADSSAAEGTAFTVTVSRASQQLSASNKTGEIDISDKKREEEKKFFLHFCNTRVRIRSGSTRGFPKTKGKDQPPGRLLFCLEPKQNKGR